MNFFEAQDRARRRTHILVALFLAAVVAIVCSVYLVVGIAGYATMGIQPAFDPALFGVVALGTGLLIGGGSLFRSAQLRRGGPAVAELLGGRPVAPDTRDSGERRLLNVVEEMAVASGTPVPAIYVLDREGGINAFAAGYGLHDAAIAVTRGTLEQLDRDELQGVIAHEFSHILNGDMRLNIRLMGLLFGILLLAVVGRGLLRGSMMSRRQRDGRAALLGAALVGLGYLGVLFGKLIKAAVSRQREFLADAAAVQFTRNPEGIAGALRKIGAGGEGSRIRNHHAEELSHLFFANGVGRALSGLTSTHPPLRARILRVLPSWNGDFSTPIGRDAARKVTGRERDIGPSEKAARPDPLSPERTGLLLGAAAVMAGIGAPDSSHVQHARRLLGDLPEELMRAAHDPEGAQALLLGLLGGEGEAVEVARREAAMSLDVASEGRREYGAPAGEGSSGAVSRWLDALRPLVQELPGEARLPLVDVALPALRGMEEAEAAALRSAIDRVVRADGEVHGFDFALTHILWRHLPGGRRTPPRGTVRLERVPHAVATVLSALARSGGGESPEVEAAFLRGREVVDGVDDIRLLPETQVGLVDVDRALEQLESLSLEDRRTLLHACAAVVFADERVELREAELLRAFAECLDLPLPPLVPGVAPG